MSEAEPTPAEEMDRLLDLLVQVSMDFLSRRDAFMPHAAILDADGELRFGMAEAGDEAHEAEHLELLRASLREEAAAGAIRACGLAVDVTVTDDDDIELDAIRIELDHLDEQPIIVIVPYEKGDSGYTMGEITAYLSDEPVFDQ